MAQDRDTGLGAERRQNPTGSDTDELRRGRTGETATGDDPRVRDMGEDRWNRSDPTAGQRPAGSTAHGDWTAPPAPEQRGTAIDPDTPRGGMTDTGASGRTGAHQDAEPYTEATAGTPASQRGAGWDTSGTADARGEQTLGTTAPGGTGRTEGMPGRGTDGMAEGMGRTEGASGVRGTRDPRGMDDDARGTDDPRGFGDARGTDDARGMGDPRGTSDMRGVGNADRRMPSEGDRTGRHDSARTADTAADGGEPTLLPHEEAEQWEQRLRQTTAGFVDGPRAAVEEADRELEEIASRLSEAVSRRRSTLRRSWQTGEEKTPGHETDTEQLRLALRDYRELAGRLLHL